MNRRRGVSRWRRLINVSLRERLAASEGLPEPVLDQSAAIGISTGHKHHHAAQRIGLVGRPATKRRRRKVCSGNGGEVKAVGVGRKRQDQRGEQSPNGCAAKQLHDACRQISLNGWAINHITGAFRWCGGRIGKKRGQHGGKLKSGHMCPGFGEFAPSMELGIDAVINVGEMPDLARPVCQGLASVAAALRFPSWQGCLWSNLRLWHPSGMRDVCCPSPGGVAALNPRLISYNPSGCGIGPRKTPEKGFSSFGSRATFLQICRGRHKLLAYPQNQFSHSPSSILYPPASTLFAPGPSRAGWFAIKQFSSPIT